MHYWKFSRGDTCALTLPRPVSVKFDQIAIGGWEAKKAMWINYVDFGSMPHDPMQLDGGRQLCWPAH